MFLIVCFCLSCLFFVLCCVVFCFCYDKLPLASSARLMCSATFVPTFANKNHTACPLPPQKRANVVVSDDGNGVGYYRGYHNIPQKMRHRYANFVKYCSENTEVAGIFPNHYLPSSGRLSPCGALRWVWDPHPARMSSEIPLGWPGKK